MTDLLQWGNRFSSFFEKNEAVRIMMNPHRYFNMSLQNSITQHDLPQDVLAQIHLSDQYWEINLGSRYVSYIRLGLSINDIIDSINHLKRDVDLNVDLNWCSLRVQNIRYDERLTYSQYPWISPDDYASFTEGKVGWVVTSTTYKDDRMSGQNYWSVDLGRAMQVADEEYGTW